MAIEFSDISSYQAPFDVHAYAAAGHDRILIKATEGTNYVNPDFADWWRAAGEAGLARGAYHYGRPSTGAGEVEAQRFTSALAAAGMGPRDWAVLDIEDTALGGARNAAAYVTAFTSWMDRYGIRNGVIYTGAWYADPAHITAATVAPGWRRLHLSDYTTTPDPGTVPDGWAPASVVCRQFTDKAPTAGVPTPCDRSRVLTEWIDQEDDVALTDDDVQRIAKATLQMLWNEIQQAADDKHPIRQGSPGAVIGSTYLKTGDLQTRVAALEQTVAAAAPALGPVQISGTVNLTSASAPKVAPPKTT